MGKRTASRIQKRRESEAAASRGSKAGTKKKKKAAKRKRATTRRKAKAVERKQLIWGVFSGSLKEEARFPYDQREEAEQKLEQLRAKGKKSYFIQPIKEVITTPLPSSDDEEEDS
ncbi:MAG: hypothetical protein DWQ34_10290 [Planctomycetota bacterium]|nr:MAG: hypothetical protein DWQ29_15125 [Planctomycetota bacterium]REJ93610.1 MAG: hypothetical protein DWQ34_10290 [Planctomycetota bacterium]REK19930.1 MAG: hypothetical protein DWQ41_26750 [Planctomycetota bacterium]REK27495.1 MAG: hypothetical protein DWQ45_25765 [Planctomycetota bacterium]